MRLRDRRPQRRVVLILVLVASAIALGASVAATGGKSAAAKLHAPPPAWADPDLATVTSDNFGQQFTGAFTDLGCGSTDVIADPASTINVTVTADDADERPHGQPRLPRQGRPERGHRRRAGDVRLQRLGDIAGGAYIDPGLQVRQSRDAVHAAGGPYPYDRRLHGRRRGDADGAVPAAGLDDEPGHRHADAEATATGTPRSLRRPSSIRSEPRASPSRSCRGRHDPGSRVRGGRARTTPSSTARPTTGKEFHLVADTGLRPDLPPGGGDTDIAVDDQGTMYFTDLEALANLGTSSRTTTG